ncbi:MAG: transcription antitermination factor NusB [Clostridia bacterium]|nr:transcription antitermination factor NusB [Clostridia bacterium]
MGRKEARNAAFTVLYQTEIQKCPASEVLEMYYRENKVGTKDKEYINDVVEGTIKNIEQIDSFISKGSKSWSLSRISKIDKAALRLALYEIFYREDIPDSISIFEAVELVKQYDSEEAGGFVNGILRGILRTNKDTEEK